jgi:hypothetical protein
MLGDREIVVYCGHGPRAWIAVMQLRRPGLRRIAFLRGQNTQKQGWAHFAPLEIVTTPAAARLVKFARVYHC